MNEQTLKMNPVARKLPANYGKFIDRANANLISYALLENNIVLKNVSQQRFFVYLEKYFKMDDVIYTDFIKFIFTEEMKCLKH